MSLVQKHDKMSSLIQKSLWTNSLWRKTNSHVISRLDYCNFFSHFQAALVRLKNSSVNPKCSSVCVLIQTNIRYHISPVLASLHWLPVKSRIELKILQSYSWSGTILSLRAHGSLSSLQNFTLSGCRLLMIPRNYKSRMGGGAFSCQASLLRSHLPVLVSVV